MADNLDDNPDYIDVTPDGSSTRIFKNVNVEDNAANEAEVKEFLAYEDFIVRKPALMESGIAKLVKLGLTRDEVMAVLGFYTP